MQAKTCIICTHHTNLLYDGQFDINYYFCPRCHFISMDESAIVPPEEEVRIYNLHNNTLENVGYVKMFRDFMARCIHPYYQGRGKVLEFGCGPGPVLASLLKEEGFDVDTYDPYFSPEKVYEEKKYHVITATEVLEHLKNPLDTLGMLKNHLEPGGILAIMTLFHPQNDELFKDWWYRRDPTHISFYTPRTFRVLARNLNLNIIYIDKKKSVVLEKPIKPT